MGQFVFNIAKGRAVELYRRVEENDPSTSALLVVAINAGATTDDTMRGYDTLSALLGDTNVIEVTNTNYARKVLTDTELAAVTTGLDDTNDRFRIELPDQTWDPGPLAGDAWTDLVVCYRNATADADTLIIPLTCHDFPITPDGSVILADFLEVASGGFFEASGAIT